MSFTKTQEQKQERWARIAELEVLNKVMTPAQSISARNKQKKATILADKAENVINSLTQSVRVSKAPMGTNPLTVEDKAPVPDANTFLPIERR